MRIANLEGRAVLVDGDRALDIERASDGQFGPDLQPLLEDWAEFAAWAGTQDASAGEPFDAEQLGPPVPRPPQVFGIGLNYKDHAEEAGLDLPDEPMVFTKFPSSVTGPYAEVPLPSDRCDFEVELVVVIGQEGHQIAVEDAWEHVAGLTVGQDLSERAVQFQSKPPQFSMGKSFPGFSPIGPVLVTPDEFADRDRLAIGCTSGEESLQDGTTADMVFSVAELVAKLSAIVRLLPGDLIFSGTPAGVGAVREPKRYLSSGEVIVSTIEGIGTMRTTLV
ncbi:fumarylacetoacetate hydrolase family protein [Ornithinimicrobium faecis]|uniref:fumarylacetoacetate hydrolase family protein n=1 Tax=Ornithinimicrobium faecis TaxID=2934158 RepID=UPI002118FF9F|nr:fumarylacetoacetate hydrolase family protein [Ornithinimicrobium sp. HY1745]